MSPSLPCSVRLPLSRRLRLTPLKWGPLPNIEQYQRQLADLSRMEAWGQEEGNQAGAALEGIRDLLLSVAADDSDPQPATAAAAAEGEETEAGEDGQAAQQQKRQKQQKRRPSSGRSGSGGDGGSRGDSTWSEGEELEPEVLAGERHSQSGR